MDTSSFITTPWLVGPADKPDATVTLICFGSAGSGGSQFRAWNRRTPPWLRVIGVQLPGREERYREALFKDCAVLAEKIADAIVLQPAGQLAFFGHSFGALLAFETARRLRRIGMAQPCWLCVAGRAAPHLPYTYRKTYALPESEFMDVLRRYGGCDKRILETPEILGFFLAAIRADLEVNTEYIHQIEAPLSMPITAMRGIDDIVCSTDEFLKWRDLTTGEFYSYEWDGDHFFFRQNLDKLLAVVTSTLAAHAMRHEYAALP